MKKAFTLAEVLITLGIIGIVAVLTLPTLMDNHQKKIYVAKLQKNYNQLSNAYENFLVDEDSDSLSEISFDAGTFLEKYFKTVKTCDAGKLINSECLADSYKYLNGNSLTFSNNQDEGSSEYNCAIINTGATICINSDGNSIVVDTNGKDSPNVKGRDLFFFAANDKGSISDISTSIDDCSSEYMGGCLLYIQEYSWKMNY